MLGDPKKRKHRRENSDKLVIQVIIDAYTEIVQAYVDFYSRSGSGSGKYSPSRQSA